MKRFADVVMRTQLQNALNVQIAYTGLISSGFRPLQHKATLIMKETCHYVELKLFAMGSIHKTALQVQP